MRQILIVILFIPYFALAQCPFGNASRVECVSGCGNFVDRDGDGFCDYSRILARETTDTLSTILKTNRTRTPKQTKKNKNFNQEQTAQIIEIETDTVKILSNETSTITEEPPIKLPFKKTYRLILISTLTLGTYLLTFLLSRFGILHKVYHRRIWNTLLLLTAAVSCLFGFFLVIQLNYGLLPDCYRSILTWHVECGIAMTIIAVFHVSWHFSYYKKVFKKY